MNWTPQFRGFIVVSVSFQGHGSTWSSTHHPGNGLCCTCRQRSWMLIWSVSETWTNLPTEKPHNSNIIWIWLVWKWYIYIYIWKPNSWYAIVWKPFQTKLVFEILNIENPPYRWFTQGCFNLSSRLCPDPGLFRLKNTVGWLKSQGQPPGMVWNPINIWDKLPTSTGAGFQPSTVRHLRLQYVPPINLLFGTLGRWGSALRICSQMSAWKAFPCLGLWWMFFVKRPSSYMPRNTWIYIYIIKYIIIYIYMIHAIFGIAVSKGFNLIGDSFVSSI